MQKKRPIPVYELWIILKNESSKKISTQICEYITKLIVENGGYTSYPKQNGNKLIFFTKSEIRKFKKGKSVSFVFTAPPTILSWLNQFLNLSDQIERHLIVRK